LREGLMTVLVTGGTGLVGGTIVDALLQRGVNVRVLARDPERASDLAARGVQIKAGDILDQASIEAALQGCRVLYHAAAIYEVDLPDKKRLLQTEIAGTEHALKAARRCGVERVVYTSSAITIGEVSGSIGNENTPHRGHFHSAYEEAKYRAEQVALEHARQGLPVVLVNPAMVYGPGDLKPPARGLLNILNGVYPGIYAGALSFVYLDDVGEGHLLAAEHGQPGERYILCDRHFSLPEWYGTAARLAGARLPRRFPVIVAGAYARLSSVTAKFSGKPALLSYESFKTAAYGFRVDGSRARQELGLRHLPFKEGLRRTINWYWSHGYLKHKPDCAPENTG
jgi:dihydroflavonol-4-reductase